MSFFDAAFIFAFLPLSLIAFYCAGRWLGAGGAMMALTVASIIFCLPFGLRFTGLMLASAVVNWLLCRALSEPDRSREARDWILRGGVLFNLALLCVFKYWNAFTWIPLAQAMASSIELWVPITISFYTFQRLVLLVDCHRREPSALALAENGKLQARGFAAFVTGFPNLIIGPIAYASEVAPQFLSKRFGRLRRSDIEVGLALLAMGLFKKVVIADSLGASVVDGVFGKVAAGSPVLALDVLIAMLGYYAQLYFDFSGYSDMALGLARLFGIRLPYNFNSPLRATGIVDFYRRWHITLTRIVARFLFQPLSIAGTRWTSRRRWRGWRAKPMTSWAPLLANFLVIGIWHGAQWTFVLFGVIHGLWFVLETEVRATKWWRNWVKRSPDRLRLHLGQAITILPLAITFSLFRSPSVDRFLALFVYLKQDWLAFFDGRSAHAILQDGLVLLMFAFAIIWLAPNTMELLKRYRSGITTFVVPSHTPALLAFRWRPTAIWGLFVFILLMWVIYSLGAPAPFAYGGF